MITTTAIPSERRHQWHIRFDRIVCRDCGAVRGVDDGKRCRGATRIRPMAGIRQDVGLLGQKAKSDPSSLLIAIRQERT